jgi:predicted nucleic acid-binding protein
MSKIISNASPLIGLSSIKELTLLRKLFSELVIPTAVYDEVVVEGKNEAGSQEVEQACGDWIKVLPVANKAEVDILLAVLDRGEAETIVLAQELNSELVLLDNREARIFAKKIGLNILGTVGVLQLAREKGFIKDLVKKLEALRNKGFWLSDLLIDEVRKRISGNSKSKKR